MTRFVSTTLTNYPLLYSVTDTNLRDNVTDAEGDDIVFRGFDDTTCGGPGTAPCILDHEIEKWVGATGELVAWVRVPSVNTNMAGTDTGIEILYGDSSVTTSTQNPTGVWDSNFVMVQHLQETSGTHFDSTGSSLANDGTNSGSNQNATGKIDGANDFIDSGDIRITDKASFDITCPITVEALVNINNLAATFDYVVAKSDIGNNGRSYSIYYNVDVLSFDF